MIEKVGAVVLVLAIAALGLFARYQRERIIALEAQVEALAGACRP